MRFNRSQLHGSRACAAAIIFTLMAGSPALTQVTASRLRVAVGIVPPFVMQQEAVQPTGFSIDLWNAVASKLKTSTSYQMFPDVASVVDAIKSKLVDVVAA